MQFMRPRLAVATWIAVAGLSACTTLPTGPAVTALPGTGKNFDQFRSDEAACRQYAQVQVGGNTPNDNATHSALTGAAVGTVVGALAGAAIGGHQGAGAGAGMGLIVGSAAGAGAGDASARGTQARYDSAYVQCMYAKGHKVPVAGRIVQHGQVAPAGAPAAVAPQGYSQPGNPYYRPPPPAPPRRYVPPTNVPPPQGYPPPNMPAPSGYPSGNPAPWPTT